jgi:GNAT superfamily N-acetyltransferase
MAPLIVSLSQRPDLASTVANWQWQEWGSKQGRQLDCVEREVALLVDPANDEAGYVLLDGDLPVGTACLTMIDLETRPDLSPWLASVFVVPQARRQGHAARLVRAVEADAFARGHRRLWLFTWETAPLYARLGWEVAGEECHFDELVTLMFRDLRA